MHSISITRKNVNLIVKGFDFVKQSEMSRKSDAISIINKINERLVKEDGDVIDIPLERNEIRLIKKSLYYLAYKKICDSLGKDKAEDVLLKIREIENLKEVESEEDEEIRMMEGDY